MRAPGSRMLFQRLSLKSDRALISAIAVTAILLLSSCQPLYFPLVPEIHRPAPRIQLGLEFVEVDGRPEVQILVVTVPHEGWLALQWFAPGRGQVASESIWLEPDSVGQQLSVPLPEDIAATPGEWRVLLSQGDVVVRQLSVVLE